MLKKEVREVRWPDRLLQSWIKKRPKVTTSAVHIPGIFKRGERTITGTANNTVISCVNK